MISGDFFATLPAPRVAYPGRSSSRHIRLVPASPPLSSRQFATVSLRRASRPLAPAARRFSSAVPSFGSLGGTIGRPSLPRYSRNGEISICCFPPCLPPCLIALSPRRLLLPAFRPALPCRGAGCADCLPRSRPTAYDTAQSTHFLRDDTSRKTDSRISLISRYFRITSDTVVSHHDESSFPPHALPCDTGSGEMPSPFACLPVPFPTMLGIARRIQYRDNSMADPICAFSVDGGFSGYHVPSPCYYTNIPSGRSFRGFYSPVETASPVGLLIGNAFVRELFLPEAVLIMLDDRQAWDSIVLDEIAPSIPTDGRGDFL